MKLKALLIIAVFAITVGCAASPTEQSITPSPTASTLPTPTSSPTVSQRRVQAPVKVSQLVSSFPVPLSTGLSMADIIDTALESVVEIRTDLGSGTGFIVLSDGLIVTNLHVVENSNSITVRLATGGSYSAELLGQHSFLDLAYLGIQSDDVFSPMSFGDSSLVRLGDEVIVLGFPLGSTLGQEPTVTQGIISSIRDEALQTDASVNPGNSGGPLLDHSGNAIGVVVSRIEESGGRDVTGIGFAIPINEVRLDIADMAAGGLIEATPPPPSTPTSTPTPGPTATPTFTPTPPPTATPTATATPPPINHCREWESMVLEWVEQGNVYQHSSFDRDEGLPQHPEITSKQARALCITDFPIGQLTTYATAWYAIVGEGAGELLPGTYRYRSEHGDDRVRGNNCSLQVNIDGQVGETTPLVYGETFEFTFHAYHKKVSLGGVCTGSLRRVGDA